MAKKEATTKRKPKAKAAPKRKTRKKSTAKSDASSGARGGTGRSSSRQPRSAAGSDAAAARRRSSTPRNSEPPAPPPPTWDEILIRRIVPWRTELAGWLIFFAAIITLFGVADLIQPDNLLLTGYFRLVRQVAGWGSFFFALSIGAGGLFLALRKLDLPVKITLPQIIGGELLLLVALPLSYLLTDGTLATARSGQSGGLIGWGLAQPLLDFLGPFMTWTVMLGVAAYAIGLIRQITWADNLAFMRRLALKLRVWANRIDAPRVVEAVEDDDDVPTPAVTPTPPAPNTPELAPAALADPLAITETEAAPKRKRRSRMLPPFSLLTKGGISTMSNAEIDQKKAIIEQTLRDFGLTGEVTEVRRGPVVTQFGVKPGYLVRNGPNGEPKKYKVRVNQIAGLNRDLALALAVKRLRIQAPVPGRGIVGVEVPNAETAVVRLHTVLTSDPFRKLDKPLAVALGLDVSGNAKVANLGKMPHLLIAGTTGSGKSVFINALVTSLIFNNKPDQLKLVMIDPKKVELIRYNGLPHLLGKVETEHERVIGVLQWIVAEMDRRYQEFAEVGAKDLDGYNRMIKRYKDVQPMPYMAVFIDELADLMAVYPAEVERALCRLAQMARATGIHLVVATQRPSTDVITGLIKANFPARASFSVASSTDSRVILDTTGAESLLGKGDMLFLPPEASAPQRIQGCFVSDTEIDNIVAHWHKMKPTNENDRPERAPWERLIARQAKLDETDQLLERAIELVQKHDTVSTSLLQRRLRIGFPRAARMMEILHEMGLVEDPKHGGKTRKTYVAPEDEDPLEAMLFDTD